MGVDHRGRHVLVAEELMHGTDVVAGTETPSPTAPHLLDAASGGTG
jgi:hypothetical protein